MAPEESSRMLTKGTLSSPFIGPCSRRSLWMKFLEEGNLICELSDDSKPWCHRYLSKNKPLLELFVRTVFEHLA